MSPKCILELSTINLLFEQLQRALYETKVVERRDRALAAFAGKVQSETHEGL